MYRVERWGNMPPNAAWSPEFVTNRPSSDTRVGSADSSDGFVERPFSFSHGTSSANNNNGSRTSFLRATVSYGQRRSPAEGGFSDSFGYLESTAYDYSPYAFFINIPGAPPTVRVINQKSRRSSEIDQDYDIGVFVQDRWTTGRATTTLGLRYDSFKGPRRHRSSGRTPLTPNRADIALPETPLVHWQDVTPRLGVTYDLRGNGKPPSRPA